GTGMAHNPYGLGARTPINSAARLGGSSGMGRLGGINNRPGGGIIPTAMNRAGLSNRSLAVNRTNNTFNSTRNLVTQGNWGWRNSYGGPHQNWLHGRWNGFNGGYGGYGRGYGGYGRGYGYGGFGRGFGYGGFGRGYGYPGYGLGYGGFGYGLGYGLGLG